MCCGQFKNDLFKQNLINESFLTLSKEVNSELSLPDSYKDKAKGLMHKELKMQEITIKLKQ